MIASGSPLKQKPVSVRDTDRYGFWHDAGEKVAGKLSGVIAFNTDFFAAQKDQNSDRGRNGMIYTEICRKEAGEII